MRFPVTVPAARSRRAGHTLVEISLTFVLFSGLLAAFSASLAGPMEEERALEQRTEARRRVDRALDRVQRTLTRTAWDQGFPAIVDAEALAVDHPDIAAVADFAGGPGAQVLLFLEPVDADGDGWPDLNGDGSMVLDARPDALGLVSDADGLGTLVLVDAERDVSRIARGLSEVRFLDSAASGFTQPLDALRIAASAPRGRDDAPPLTGELLVRLGRQDP